jgi:hypothetical protein
MKQGFEESVKVYGTDILAIEPIVKNIENKMLPRKRVREAGFPANSFSFVLMYFARAVKNLDPHQISRCREDAEFVATWVLNNPPKPKKSSIIIGS